MTFLLSLVAGQWAKYFWPALALISLFFYWNHLTSKIDDLQKDNKQLQDNIVVYQQNEVKLKDSIKQQNDSITVMNQQFVSLSKAAVDLVKGTNKNNDEMKNKLSGQINSINSIATPKDCQSAIDLIIDVAKVNKWSTNKGDTK